MWRGGRERCVLPPPLQRDLLRGLQVLLPSHGPDESRLQVSLSGQVLRGAAQGEPESAVPGLSLQQVHPVGHEDRL